jgi:hypothetical protein
MMFKEKRASLFFMRSGFCTGFYWEIEGECGGEKRIEG